MLIIRPAEFPAERDAVIEIFREYVGSPTVSLDFQDFEAEFAELPGKYAPPTAACCSHVMATRCWAVPRCAAWTTAAVK